MKVLKKILNGTFRGLDNSLFYWNFALMSAVAVLVIATVFLRYLFNVTFTWTEELIIFLFIATTYFGSILGVREDEHVKISIFKEKLPPKIKIIFEILISCIIISVVVASAILSRDWIVRAGRPLSPGIKIPYFSIYIIVPIAFALIAIYECREIVLKVNDFKKKNNKF
ncbi:MAG: TRAP transporter small permease [Candidatus Ratteibacteria bacterium]|nr:TRAP transporter small permease [Candidatus Ratteibacteria bacterium]